ncbi:hypothetical protein [Sphingomonas sp. 28-62-11]|uniref:hypothetical protein n=1 Tax=Sphingomonas sp. 28-62-11 TaxID=1970432 RepID=UPI0035A87070
MVDNLNPDRNPDGTHTVRETTIVTKSGGMNTLLIVLLAVAAIVGLLFATGFWSADVKNGALPEVSVQGGALPDVDLDSKEVVVGTTKAEIDVPKIKTEKEEVSVPTIGVRDGKTDEKK